MFSRGRPMECSGCGNRVRLRKNVRVSKAMPDECPDCGEKLDDPANDGRLLNK